MRLAAQTIEIAVFWLTMAFTAGVITVAALAAFGVIR